MLLIALLLQAGLDSGAPPPSFDLGKLPPRRGTCGADGAGGEIVVCARTGQGDRLEPVAEIDEDPPKAETGLFGKVRGGVAAEGGNVGGFQSNRVMVKVKVPL